jgi:hypothetical protein
MPERGDRPTRSVDAGAAPSVFVSPGVAAGRAASYARGAMPRRTDRAAVPLAALAAVLSSCEGRIGDADLYVPGEGRVAPDAGADGTDGGAVGGPELDPFEGGAATLGVLCGANGARGRLVLTAEAGGCQAHAELLSGGTPVGDRALADIPVITRAGRYEGAAEICLDGDCEARPLELEIDALDANGAIGRWSIPIEGRTAAGPLQATRCAYDAFLPGRDPNLVPNLAITEVAIYQGVKASLAAEGMEAPRDVPVVAGRPGLLRVFVEPQVGFLQSRVEAVLTLEQGAGQAPSVRRAALDVAISSREAARATTFEIPLAADDIGPDTRWSIALRGEEACAGLNADTSGARYPASGTVDLGAEPVGPLNVTLVPFRYLPNGGRLPDTSEAQLERYREVLFGMFPVEAVNLTVRDPVDLELTVTGQSSTWGPVLQRLFTVRAEDDPPPATYYYGLIDPRAGGWSGTAGLGPLPSAADVTRRGAIGLGRPGRGSAITCAHELGHAAGRRHAPCGGAGRPDPMYPYADGSIGVWGYDLVSDSLKDPDTANDLMGYCRNDWISDYNYNALVRRYQYVHQNAPRVVAAPAPWRSIYLAPETEPLEGGAAHHWEDVVRLPRPPRGDRSLSVRYLAASGEVLAEDRAEVIALDHTDGVIAWLPAAPEGTTAVALDGRVVPY